MWCVARVTCLVTYNRWKLQSCIYSIANVMLRERKAFHVCALTNMAPGVAIFSDNAPSVERQLYN